MPGYVGRFAPSPTGALHAGSLVAALASWLDARAHGGRWLVRMEDVDTPRCVAGADRVILDQLARCGLVSDGPVMWQSARATAYAAALEALLRSGAAYRCACSRQDIERALAARGVPRERHGERVYPGTCRPSHGGLQGRTPRAVRLLSCDADGGDIEIGWHDRRLGAQRQNVTQAVGDFVLRRADGLWAYQLAVVVDDAAQGISAIVRGEDLADNTARQILLQQRLGLATPSYLHTPLVLAADGHKLSKQNGAQALALDDDAAVLAALRDAATVLGLPPALQAGTPAPGNWLAAATQAWRAQLDAGIIGAFQPDDRESQTCPPPPPAA